MPGDASEQLIAEFEAAGYESWLVDGEDLADGDVEQLLESMAPALARCGVRLMVETTESPWQTDSAGYRVRINQIDIDLYRFDPEKPNVPLSDDPWMDCTLKPLSVVNTLLAEAGAGKRLAVISPGGNDGMAFLLPPERLSKGEMERDSSLIVP